MNPKLRWQRLVHSLTARLFVALAVTLALTFGANAALNVRTTRAEWERMVRESAQQTSDVILSATRYGMLLNHKEDVHHTIETIAASHDVENVRIYDKLGTIIHSAQPDEIGGSVDVNAEACVSCHTGPTPLQTLPAGGRTRIFARAAGERVLGVITPIPNAPDCSSAACHVHSPEQSVLGVLDVTMSLADEDALLAGLERRSLIAAVAAALLAGLMTATFVMRVVRRPVRALVRGVRRVAAGDLDTEIVLTSASELGQLAEAFNHMTHDLRRAHAELTGWSERLEVNLQEKTVALGRTQRQVAHMDKMASLGRLAATVAHELNNPLAGILNYAKLVERTLRDGDAGAREREELRHYVELIQKEAGRSGRIVRNLLAFARQSGGAFTLQPLAPVLERALTLVRHSMQMAQIRVEAPTPEGDDRLCCDADQIQQALVALFVNAIEAMPSGGVLRVQMRGRADALVLEVGDTGCGIAPENLPHIFEPFFTSKDGGVGAGLGLAVVYGIVQRHLGTIEVDSQPGMGTTFRITLPRAGRADGPDAREHETVAAAAGTRSP